MRICEFVRPSIREVGDKAAKLKNGCRTRPGWQDADSGDVGRRMRMRAGRKGGRSAGGLRAPLSSSHPRFHSYLIRFSLFSSALQPTLQRCTKSPRNEPRNGLGCVLPWVRARPLSPALPPAPAPTPTYWPGLDLLLSNRPDHALIPVCSTLPMLEKRTARARRPAPRAQPHEPYQRRTRARALPARVHRVQALLDPRARRGQCARSPAPARAPRRRCSRTSRPPRSLRVSQPEAAAQAEAREETRGRYPGRGLAHTRRGQAAAHTRGADHDQGPRRVGRLRALRA
jgi:hypothetical protein